MANLTAMDVLHQVDALLPNQYGEAEKYRWLAQAEGFVAEEVLRCCEGAEVSVPDTLEGGETLLVPPPYDELYRHYLERCIHYANGETELCNNAAAAWNSAFLTFRDFWFRTHKPCRTAQALHFF